jgi:predicted MPP superfamily phosphohydrolase
MAMMLFFTIVTVVLTLVNVYIYKHTKPIFNIEGWIGNFYKILFIFCAISYPLGRFLERVLPSTGSDLIVKVGSFWLGAMVYLILMFIFTDIIRLIYPLFGFNYSFDPKVNPEHFKKITIGIYTATAFVLLGGYINALYPRVNQISIATKKSIEGYSKLRIGAASDIHLGTLISNGRLERFVNLMNAQNPDIILLPGDIFDEDLGPVIKNDMGKLLSQLSAPLGVYAVTGNHEYIGGVDPAVTYLENHGVQVLRDTSISVNGIMNIVGREDRQAKIMGGIIRKPLKKLTESIDNNHYTILLDHQPYDLNEAVENGIDLQISGHTHHGQLFPFNYITRAIFEVSRGLKQIENTFIYVSNGFGTWGPPVRVGNRPEIVVIEVVREN